MLTPLSQTSPLPLREQLVQQVRELILSGTLAEHSRLPSIRALAREQGVGVVTVQRAFEDLEREGMVYGRQGKGYFVSPIAAERRRLVARDQTRAHMERPVREARAMGLADELVFLSDGALALHAAKDELLDSWRRLLFRHGAEMPHLQYVVHQARAGETWELVARNGERTMEGPPGSRRRERSSELPHPGGDRRPHHEGGRGCLGSSWPSAGASRCSFPSASPCG